MAPKPSLDHAPEVPAQRPSILDPETALYTASEMLALFDEWHSARGLPVKSYSKGDDAHRRTEIAVCLQGNTDAYTMAKTADMHMGWPADDALIDLFRTACKARFNVQKHLTRRWVMASGVRVPCKVNDTLRYRYKINAHGQRTERDHGVAIHIEADLGQLVVRSMSAGSEIIRRVNAENVLSVTAAVPDPSGPDNPDGGHTGYAPTSFTEGAASELAAMQAA